MGRTEYRSGPILIETRDLAALEEILRSQSQRIVLRRYGCE